jgi:hypothetical protein
VRNTEHVELIVFGSEGDYWACHILSR